MPDGRMGLDLSVWTWTDNPTLAPNLKPPGKALRSYVTPDLRTGINSLKKVSRFFASFLALTLLALSLFC